MTESTAAGKWIACMNYLQQNLPNQEYDTWFAPLQFVALTGHTLTISTPNKFVGDYIGKNYRDLMRAALLQMFDAETTLVWQDAPGQRHRPGDCGPSSREARALRIGPRV